MTTASREQLGRIVRQAWVQWAREQDTPKPSWLTGWDELDDGQREVDMRIGEAVAGQERERILAIAERLKEPHTGPRSNAVEYAVPLSLLQAALAPDPAAQCDRPRCGWDAEWRNPA